MRLPGIVALTAGALAALASGSAAAADHRPGGHGPGAHAPEMPTGAPNEGNYVVYVTTHTTVYTTAVVVTEANIVVTTVVTKFAEVVVTTTVDAPTETPTPDPALASQPNILLAKDAIGNVYEVELQPGPGSSMVGTTEMDADAVPTRFFVEPGTNRLGAVMQDGTGTTLWANYPADWTGGVTDIRPLTFSATADGYMKCSLYLNRIMTCLGANQNKVAFVLQGTDVMIAQALSTLNPPPIRLWIADSVTPGPS